MKYEYLLLLCPTVVLLAFQMPHMPLFFVADISHFDSHPRRIADGILFIMDGLLINFPPFSDISITIALLKSPYNLFTWKKQTPNQSLPGKKVCPKTAKFKKAVRTRRRKFTGLIFLYWLVFTF